jgi:hypothetical protein
VGYGEEYAKRNKSKKEKGNTEILQPGGEFTPKLAFNV